MNEKDLSDVRAFAEQLADVARATARQYFRTALSVSVKSDRSPVTEADNEIERQVRDAISERYPDHAFFGEESGGTMLNGPTWVVDPIDGTKSFICGVPLFGSLIAFLVAGRPVIGVLEMPALRERWVGAAGRTLCNDARASVSGCKSLAEARLFSTSPDMFVGEFADAFARISEQVGLRRFGTDCYAYGLLASGHCDLVVESGLKAYDVMALVPIIENAGGVVSDWRGQPIDTAFSGQIVAAATRQLHDEALAVLRAT
ncbi:histidinol-phosphatase [Cupriavidus pauculus]|uniref:histidinol-phosphatase n=1 Tax=Cupriavidus pauculus TaxID=82633 RepID=UPI001EE25DFD|nr:histidinol-phosphatase [Cupriavidus pauculus]GJG95022.1 histidinol-phosphatase [Cupriavidus pauculus]